MERGRYSVDTRRLIEMVKANPMLYDPTAEDYKDVKRRDELWERMAREMDQHPDDLKKKWKNLRDTYIRYARASKTKQGGSNPSSLSKWTWSKHMRFFRPFFSLSKRRARAEEAFDDTTEIEPHFDHHFKMEVEEVVLQEQDPVYPQDVPDCEVLLGRKSQNHSQGGVETDLDDTELLFVALAKTIKKFSKKRQAKAKMLVAKVVMEQELLDIEEQNVTEQGGDFACPPSSSDSTSMDFNRRGDGSRRQTANNVINC